MKNLTLQRVIRFYFIIVSNFIIFYIYMKIKNIINIFYFLTILNYVLHYKLSCFISLIGSHIIFYFVFKNDTKSKLLSILTSIFLFCGQIMETNNTICSVEKTNECKQKNEICINNICRKSVCTKEKIKSCRAWGAVCRESIGGCFFKKKRVDYVGIPNVPDFSTIARSNLYNKRVHMKNLLDKYD